ncbi:MAG: hypothetical protein KDK78_09970 [Chlamydiia bacterium]|nr:hypothetical protein [Chlamydiia bacterium]
MSDLKLSVLDSVRKWMQAWQAAAVAKERTDWKGCSKAVRDLWKSAESGAGFQAAWDATPRADRKTFTRLLDGDSSPRAMKAKAELTDFIYRMVGDLKERALSWPSHWDQPTYYHATSYKALLAILESGCLQVRHESVFRGAFVSTCPEIQYGRYILVFNRSIEHLSELETSLSFSDFHWAGFSKDIPINSETLHGIYISNGDERELNKVRKRCTEIAKRNILVARLPYALTRPYPASRNLAIPREW